MKKFTNASFPTMCFGLLMAAPLVMGQTPQGNVYFGLGTATDSSNGQALNLFGTGTPYNTPKMTGLFADVGGSFMFTNHFGAGAQLSWRAGQGDYSGVNYRPFFYDFNGIWQPVKSKRSGAGNSGGPGRCQRSLQCQLSKLLRSAGGMPVRQFRLGKLDPFPGSHVRGCTAVCDSTYLFPAGRGCALGE